MKKISLYLILIYLVACKNDQSQPSKDYKGKEIKTSQTLNYPFVPTNSSELSIGNPKHSKIVLDYIKCWEENRIDDMKSLIADSVTIYFSNGYHFYGSVDSMLFLVKQARASYVKVEITIEKWLPVHINDKVEDHVIIWESETLIHTSGRINTIRTVSDWTVRDNKIIGWKDYEQKVD